MGRVLNPAGRCRICRMRLEYCLCAEMPSFVIETRLILLMHYREAFSTTNTGRLATLALPNSELRLRGLKSRVMDVSNLCPPNGTSFFLYPTPDSVELSVELLAEHPRPYRLIVPDGTWRQAAKVYRREPALSDAVPTRLPTGATSSYFLRRAPQPHCLCTLEAIAQALGVIEGPQIQGELERVLHKMVERTLSSRSPDSRGRTGRTGLKTDRKSATWELEPLGVD